MGNNLPVPQRNTEDHNDHVLRRRSTTNKEKGEMDYQSSICGTDVTGVNTRLNPPGCIG